MSWSKFVFFIVLIIFISQKFPSLAQRIHQSVLVTLVQERAVALFNPIAINVTATNSSSPQLQPKIKATVRAKQPPLTTLKAENRLIKVPAQERCRPVKTELDKMLKEQNVGCWL